MLDRPGRLAVGHVRAHDIRDGDEERFVGLERRVAVHRHAERVRTRTTGRDHLTGERLRHIVRILFGTAGVLGGSVGGGDVERDPSVAGRLGERDIENQGRGAVVALDGRGVPDRQSGHDTRELWRGGVARTRRGGREVHAVVVGVDAAVAGPEVCESWREGVGAGPVPSKKLAVPKPTRSTICANCAAEHGVLEPLHARPVVVFARITLPAPPAMLIEPDASGVGSGLPFAPPDACCTR